MIKRVITLIIALIFIGLYHLPAFAGEVDDVLTVLTLNLHNGRDSRGENNINRFKELIHNTSPDIVALQETQVKHRKELSLTGYQTIIGPNANLAFFRFGNTLMIRGRVVYHRHHYLPGKLEQRGADEVGAEIGGRYFTIINTHLGLGRSERERQLQELFRIIRHIQGPIILLGDFNMEPTDKLFQAVRGSFREAGDEHPLGNSFPTGAPKHRLDHIWYDNNWELRDAQTINWDGSDHLPVLARLDYLKSWDIPLEMAVIPSLDAFDNPILPETRRPRYGLELSGENSKEDSKLNATGWIPLGSNLQGIVGLKDTEPYVGLGYISNAFDLRDYASLIKVSGEGQWGFSVSVSEEEEEDPWLTWEQSYRWSHNWGTQIITSSRNSDPTIRLEQVYAPTDRLGYLLSLDTDGKYSLGLRARIGRDSFIQLKFSPDDSQSLWQLTWNR